MLNSCPYFSECGGCDFLDLSQENYRAVKKNILGAQFENADWIWVGEHSRRKIILQIGAKNQLGFFAKKSKEIAEIESCLVSEPKISALILPLKNFLKKQEQNFFTQVAITLFDNGLDVVLFAKKELNFSQSQKVFAFGQEQNLNISYSHKNQITPVFLPRKNQIFYDDFKIELSSDIFIKATKSGLEAIVKIIKNFLKNAAVEQNHPSSREAQQNPLLQKGQARIADIYAGFGAYSFAISHLVKKISAFEGEEKMVDAINKNAAANNLGNKIIAQTHDLFLNPIRAKDLKNFDLAIINPPRNGAAPQVLEITKSTLKNLIYVSCNPQSFAHDAKILTDAGFKITSLTALDQFYSTKHLELVAIFQS
jgi:23S rRNA (uracil1939-C5)-methyltransferase